MEAKPESSAPATGTVLGVFDVTLQADPGGTTYATSTQIQSSSDGIAREVALIVGALLFAQRQMRTINDPARIAAVDDVAASCAAARENRLVPRSLGGNARLLATYRIELVANGSFRINVDQKLAGMLHDSAGSLATGALGSELLSTLAEPYRTFLREMFEASQHYWRDRRPSAIESTWEWGVALGRLNQLVRQGAPPAAAPEICEACRALRPAGYSCLRCGSPPSLAQTLRNTPSVATTTIQSMPIVPETRVVEPPIVSQPSQPVAAPELSVPALTPIPTVAARPIEAPPRTGEERTILPAREAPIAIAAAEVAVVEQDAWPLASLSRRLAAWALDIISGGVLAAVGAFGLTSILLATGSIGVADNPTDIVGIIAVIVLGLYLAFGWMKGETVGMLLLNLRIVRAGGRAPVGLWRSLLRGIGSLLLLVIALVFVAAVYALDLALPFVQGFAAELMLLVGIIIGLYILWVGSGQRILTAAGRQTLGDKIADTLVLVRQS